MEEYQLIAGSSQNLPTPAAATLTARTAGSNETAISTTTGTVYVYVTALTFASGKPFPPAVASVAFTQNVSVVDVTISPVAGAQQYNIYAGTTTGTTNVYLQAGTSVQSSTTYAGKQTANAVGGIRFTIQGAIATSASNTNPPTTDSGTGGSNNVEGLIPTLTGLSASGAGPYSNALFESGASSAWQGGYVNQSVGTHLTHQRDLHRLGCHVGEQRPQQRVPGQVPGGPVRDRQQTAAT